MHASSLATLETLAERAGSRAQLVHWLANRGELRRVDGKLAKSVESAHAELTRQCASIAGASQLAGVSPQHASLVLAWAEAVADQASGQLGFLLNGLRGQVFASKVAEKRALCGPYDDALLCLPATDPEWLLRDRKARARFELLIHRAASGAAPQPTLGRWLGSSPAVIEWLLANAEFGALPLQLFTARLSAVCAAGLEPRARWAPRIGPVLWRLLTHPEPGVWIHAARGLGRLAAAFEPTARQLLPLVAADFPHARLRRRATLALASAPADAPVSLTERLPALARHEDPWTLAALGPALPNLAIEHRQLFHELLDHADSRLDEAGVAWSWSEGLVQLALSGSLEARGRELLDRFRDRALQRESSSTTDAMLWLQIKDTTDRLHHKPPASWAIEARLGLLVDSGADTEGRFATDEALTLAKSLPALALDAMKQASSATDAWEQAPALLSVENAGRALAARTWLPLLWLYEREAEPVEAAIRETASTRATGLRALIESQSTRHAAVRAGLRGLCYLADEGGATRSAWVATPRRDLNETVVAVPWDSLKVRGLKKPLAELVERLMYLSGCDPDSREGWERFSAWWGLFTDRMATLEKIAPVADHLQSARQLVAAVRSGHELQQQLDRLGLAPSQLGRTLVALQKLATAGTGTSSELVELTLLLHSLGQCRTDPAYALQLASGDASTTPLDLSALADWEAGQVTPPELAARLTATLGPILQPTLAPVVLRLVEAAAQISVRGQRVGNYLLEKQLGAGGMGAVWLARRHGSQRHFALKVVPSRRDLSQSLRDTLSRTLSAEYEVLESIYHPNVCRVIEHGTHRGSPYVVFEMLQGKNLLELRRERGLDSEEKRLVLRDVCAGLRELHRRGLVHRDLKPANVMVELSRDATNPDDLKRATLLSAVIVDFGIAHDITEGPKARPAGSPGYIAPEQALGETLEPASDIYSLAGLVYTLLTGDAFLSDVPADMILSIHAAEEPLSNRAHSSKLSPELSQLLDEATRRTPAQRPSLDDFERRLLPLL